MFGEKAGGASFFTKHTLYMRTAEGCEVSRKKENFSHPSESSPKELVRSGLSMVQ
jgi:hypothetical protein